MACSQRGLDREALEFANVAAAIAVTRMVLSHLFLHLKKSDVSDLRGKYLYRLIFNILYYVYCQQLYVSRSFSALSQ